MKMEQYMKNLESPRGPVDVILDTDAYNEIDDQFAIAYLLRSEERLRIKGFVAAPFFNSNSYSPEDGMEKSYYEIFKVLKLAGRDDLRDIVYRGSAEYMKDETTPVVSEGAVFMAELAKQYSPENPLYIVAIGAITNVASALLLNPEMKENAVVVWLGGHAFHMNHNMEFNLRQDVTAARVVFGCGVPMALLPCLGVVDHFAASRYDLEYWLKGKNELSTYLAENTIEYSIKRGLGENRPWAKPIWDVTAVAWLLNDDQCFMEDQLVHSPIPQYDHHYSFDNTRHMIKYVNRIKRNELFEDLYTKLTR